MKIKLQTSRKSGSTQTTYAGGEEVIALLRSSLSDQIVEERTVNLLNHLSERLQIAEANQGAIVEMLGAIAQDSSMSKQTMLATLEAISERLAEAPQVNLTVPVPEVNVHVEPGSCEPHVTPKEVTFKRDANGKIQEALIEGPTSQRVVHFERATGGKIKSATIEEEG